MDRQVKEMYMKMAKEMEDLERYPEKPAMYWYNMFMSLKGCTGEDCGCAES
tara:strand:- start:8549 stop:8701 length:153 start_codon:yes stop_codon:yes gene_type:complete